MRIWHFGIGGSGVKRFQIAPCVSVGSRIGDIGEVVFVLLKETVIGKIKELKPCVALCVNLNNPTHARVAGSVLSAQIVQIAHLSAG